MNLDSLKKSELFAELTDTEFEQVSKLMQHRVVPAGRPIIEEGAEAFSLFAVEKGSVDVLKNGEGGARPRITELFQGSIFGEIALLDHSRRSAEVVAHTDATIIELNYADLEALAQSSPVIGVKIYKAMAHSVSSKTRKTTNGLVSFLVNSRLVALGELTSSIAHEVKTPLTSIMLNVDVLDQLTKKVPVDHAQLDERFAVIRATIVRVAKIIDGLRGMMSETASDPFIIVAAGKLVQDSLLAWSEKPTSKDIRIETAGMELGLEMKCRAVQISQVVLNLLNNASDAIASAPSSDEQWIRVEVLDHGEFTSIAVTDSGPGVTPENQDKIFEPFYSSKGGSTGTGLGLSISRGIAERHGGGLTLDASAPHTRFVFHIPKS